MRRLRGPAAILCGILCVALLLTGVIGTYASRVLFNQTMFSNRVADAFSNPHVARVVAGEITDQIVAAYRDLTPYRPILLGVVENVVSSSAFRAIVRRAAKELHPLLIENGENFSLTMRDLGLIVRKQLAMYPGIAEKLPPKAAVVLGSTETWSNGRILMRLLRVVQRMQRRALVWLAIGLLLGWCGLALSRRKDRYLLRLGTGLVISALAIGAAARFGGPVVGGLVRSPTGSELVRGLWPVFVGPLAFRMLIVAGLGIVVVAAVTSFLERIDLPAGWRAVWAKIGRPQERPLGAIARGALLIALGIAVVASPSAMLDVAAVAVGGLLTFVGLQEFFTTALRFTKATPREAGASRSGGRRSLAVPIAVASLLVFALGAGALWLAGRSHVAPEERPAAITACNGYAALCGRRLNEVVFPDWLFPNQERGIREQLEDGVRGFLIDVHYGQKVGDRVKTLLQDESASMKKYEAVLGKEAVEAAMRIRDRLVGKPEGEPEVYLAHGFCELGATRFVTALTEMKEFLVENPDEIVIIIIQDEGVTPADVAACFAKSGLEEIVYRGAVTPPWPTLRELVERDQRVLVFAENHSEGVPWYHQAFEVFQETPYGFKTPEAMSNAPNRGGTSGSLLLMNHWIETAPASLPSNAEIVNAYDFLLSRARRCRRARGMPPNLIAVDFYRTGDLFQVCRTMNGIPEPAGPVVP
jgi:hypothetical protein